MLAVEVANASLDYDRTVKLALYARSGIPEVWIVNLAAEEVEVYQSPLDGKYTAFARAGRSDALTISAIPDVLHPGRQDIWLAALARITTVPGRNVDPRLPECCATIVSGRPPI